MFDSLSAVSRKTINFCVLLLYSVTSLNAFSSSNCVSVASIRFSAQTIVSSVNKHRDSDGHLDTSARGSRTHDCQKLETDQPKSPEGPTDE